MSDTKTLIDEYAQEAAMLRAALQERETALAMITAHLGKAAKGGGVVLTVPAAARTKARRQLAAIDLRWSAGGDWNKGALRIVGEALPPQPKDS